MMSSRIGRSPLRQAARGHAYEPLYGRRWAVVPFAGAHPVPHAVRKAPLYVTCHRRTCRTDARRTYPTLPVKGHSPERHGHISAPCCGIFPARTLARPADFQYIYIRKTENSDNDDTRIRDTPFRIREYGKTELAVLYSPRLRTVTAVKKLRRWIRGNRALMAALAEAEYNPRRLSYTPREVELIVRHLGAPG